MVPLSSVHSVRYISYRVVRRFGKLMKFPSSSTQRYFSSSRDSLAAAYVNRAAAVSSTASELDLSRKTRRRDLRGRLKLPATVTLASSTCGNEPPLLGHWGHRGASGGGPGGTGKFVSFDTSLHCSYGQDSAAHRMTDDFTSLHCSDTRNVVTYRVAA